jgi:hypothetical protein
MIFKLLMPILVNEKNHTHAETIKLSIANFSKGLGRSTFLEVTQYCYQ